mgnify:FL=1
MTNEVTKEALWEAQLSQWPDSVELTPHELARWARAHVDVYERERRWRCLAFAMLNGGPGVFYITNLIGGWVGYRYGLEAHEYMSGFCDWPVALVDGKFLECQT